MSAPSAKDFQQAGPKNGLPIEHNHADEPALPGVLAGREIFLYANRSGSHESLGLRPFEVIFINRNPDAATSAIIETAHHAAAAINLHVLPRTYHFSRKQDREIDNRSHRHISIHRKKHAVGRDVLRQRRVGSTLRRDRR